MLRRLAALTVASVMLTGGLLPAAAPPPHPALARGLALMREGDFEAAVLELDAAARKIESDPAAARHRAWAYVYLGVAYLELEQETVARGKFREALARDPDLRLVPSEFSAQSIRVFEGVRAEAAAAAPPPAAVASRPTTGASVTPAQDKKGSKGPLVAVLLGGAAAAGAAVALGGGGGESGTTTTTPIARGTTTLPDPSPSPSEPPPTAPGTPPTTTPGTPTTTTPGTPTTTTPGPTTTTVPPTTTPPTTTMPPSSCVYDISGQVNVPLTGCSGCTCSVSATPATCAWSAQTSDPAMIAITQGSGTGNGTWRFQLPAGANPASLRVVAGAVAAIAADTVTFRLAGRPGERLVFTFARR